MEGSGDQSWESLKKFLVRYKAEKHGFPQDINVIDLSTLSRYHIPISEYDTFLRLYASAIQGGAKLYLNEKVEEHFNMFVDIDFSYSSSLSSLDSQLGASLNDIIKIFGIVIKSDCNYSEEPIVTSRIIPNSAGSAASATKMADFRMSTEERKNEINPTSNSNTSTRFHLHYPNLIVDVKKAKKIRSEAICLLESIRPLPSKDINRPDLGPFNWAASIDNTYHCVRLLGSSKPGDKTGQTVYSILKGYESVNLVMHTKNNISYEDIRLTSVRLRVREDPETKR